MSETLVVWPQKFPEISVSLEVNTEVPGTSLPRAGVPGVRRAWPPATSGAVRAQSRGTRPHPREPTWTRPSGLAEGVPTPLHVHLCSSCSWASAVMSHSGVPPPPSEPRNVSAGIIASLSTQLLTSKAHAPLVTSYRTCQEAVRVYWCHNL